MALKSDDLRKLSVEELEQKLKELRAEMVVAQPTKKKSLKKSIARILTIIREKRGD